MITGPTQRLKSAAPLLKALRLLGVRPRRHLNVSGRLAGKAAPRPRPRSKVDIPGLETVSYGDRMHYVPGLSKPVYPRWEMGHRDPRFYASPPHRDMALHQDRPCFVFHQRTRVLEGVRQALWLTKTKLTAGLPPQLLSLGDSSANQVADQDERVQNAINHARFWDTTEREPPKENYCSTLLHNLLQLCSSLQASQPALGKRMLAEKYSLTASWCRGEDVFQVRGQNGLLLSSAAPLPPLADRQEVEETESHVLETFYPVSPTIDLQTINLYTPEHMSTGFRSDYPYPHAHTLYFLEGVDRRCRFRPPQLRAKMIMFCFANALARAHTLYGGAPQGVLEQPVSVQAVGTDGQTFQFAFFQLNTTDLHNDHGVKNQVWLEEDVPLYDSARLCPLIKRKQVLVPAGVVGYQPETFRKFLSLYLHGAV
ncbi:39S ribosomal protein L37, mitochondrial [Merluccius polli]|uniref:Large ribosomal subunit protein mL37 n=1 Tax=Merluccius polli TaxID=89951 RepID=A0AA47N0G1_MERPO|nr:39S ribosomal protein L37, mitochondrial [Merluccius polli]